MGQKGTGKTFAAAILGHCINKKVFYIDTVGVWSKLKLIPGAAYVKMGKVGENKLWKTFNTCYSKYKAVVLDLSYYIQSELVDFMNSFCRWALTIGNMAVIVDEVGDYCPQYREVYSVELERLVRIGRNYGVEPIIMITQRPQKVNKEILALSDFYIIFRVMHNLDREKIKDLLGYKAEQWDVLEKEIMKLPSRTAYTFDKDLNLNKLEFPIIDLQKR